MSQLRKRSLFLGLALLLSGALIGSYFNLQPGPRPAQAFPAYAASTSVADQILADRESFSSMIKPALPAVVKIASSKVVKNEANGEDGLPQDPIFRQFFGNMFPHGFQQPPHKEMGLGSGVIIESDGYVLTNNHVVDGASSIDVTLSDGRRLKGKVIGTDSKTDLALLKVAADNLPTLPLNDSTATEVGDLVFAIGNPFGVGQTVTMGIVSATSRGNLGIEDYEDFIQTDAAINPGNSGGALINAHGQLVGINTAILGRSGGNDGIGFAIPANMARHVFDQLRENGKVSRGYLGAMIQDVTPELSSAFGTKDSQGALVGDLTPDGPGSKSGLKRGDVIVSLNGESVPDSRRLRLRIADMAPGSTVELGLIRDGHSMKIPVKLGEFPDDESAAVDNDESDQGNAGKGLSLQDLTPEIRRSLNLPATAQGAVISGVAPDSPAAEAGLRRGDVIQEVNRNPVSSAGECQRALSSSGKEGTLLLVNRQGTTLFVVLQSGE